MIYVGIKDVTLSKTITADPNFSFWTYDDMYLINKATGKVLTQTPEGLQILSKVTGSKDSSQQWTLDFNGVIFFSIKKLIIYSYFWAPTGAQGVTMCVNVCYFYQKHRTQSHPSSSYLQADLKKT